MFGWRKITKWSPWAAYFSDVLTAYFVCVVASNYPSIKLFFNDVFTTYLYMRHIVCRTIKWSP